MEKYREFADAATGINPFLPVWVNNKLSVHEKLLKFLLFPLVLCRFCFLSLTLIFMIFLNSLVNLFIFQCVKDFFYQIIQGIYCRLLLFYLGFFYMDEEYASHKRVKIKYGTSHMVFTTVDLHCTYEMVSSILDVPLVVFSHHPFSEE
ncbi:hypothetical protein PVIIG_00280 [Plasmodium vivax India VII]|uniref:Uncharacterized protein n=1 Tax=Plasmodium vivax India VII TaxID=1077284 RepID=A0A0J9S7K2_PLAVI|nr:hypothetical protein PVIIG_00280 [Plasmodium vivax India VII]